MDQNIIMLAVLGGLATVLIVYSVMPRKRDNRDAVRRRLSGRRGDDSIDALREQARKSAADQLMQRATPMLSRIIMPTSDQEQTNLRVRLAMAGFRQPQAQTLFLASKSITAVICGAIGLLVAIFMHFDMTMLAGVVAFGAGTGLMLPSLWLTIAVSGRQNKVRHGLPDTLDLLVVSVEAGLALDAALKRVGDEMSPVHPELSEELRICTMESQMGLPRSEALENMAARTGVDELRTLVSVMTQAEKFGTSVAPAPYATRLTRYVPSGARRRRNALRRRPSSS